MIHLTVYKNTVPLLFLFCSFTYLNDELLYLEKVTPFNMDKFWIQIH